MEQKNDIKEKQQTQTIIKPRTHDGIRMLLDHLALETQFLVKRKFYVVYNSGGTRMVLARTHAPFKDFVIEFLPEISDRSDIEIASIFIHEVAHVATVKKNRVLRDYGKEPVLTEAHDSEFHKTYREMIKQYNERYGLSIPVIDEDDPILRERI